MPFILNKNHKKNLLKNKFNNINKELYSHFLIFIYIIYYKLDYLIIEILKILKKIKK